MVQSKEGGQRNLRSTYEQKVIKISANKTSPRANIIENNAKEGKKMPRIWRVSWVEELQVFEQFEKEKEKAEEVANELAKEGNYPFITVIEQEHNKKAEA
jgi:hypothetical protein